MSDNLQVNPRKAVPVDLPLLARMHVSDYANDHFEITDETRISESDCYVVWFAFVLGGWKALVSTSLPDGKYYEVTHNSAKQETYIDVYVKIDNICLEGETV